MANNVHLNKILHKLYRWRCVKEKLCLKGLLTYYFNLWKGLKENNDFLWMSTHPRFLKFEHWQSQTTLSFFQIRDTRLCGKWQKRLFHSLFGINNVRSYSSLRAHTYRTCKLLAAQRVYRTRCILPRRHPAGRNVYDSDVSPTADNGRDPCRKRDLREMTRIRNQLNTILLYRMVSFPNANTLNFKYSNTYVG